jgi:hypothetical protein
MGGDGSQQARDTAMSLQMALGGEEYGIAQKALTGGMGYLTAARARGGGIDQTAKYDAMRTDVAETAGRAVGAGGGMFGEGGVAGGLAAGAAGATATEAQRGSAALDEINKIRSALAGQGLASTGLAGQAGELQANAFKMMPNRPVWPSVVRGIGAAGAIAYGAFNQPGGDLKQFPTAQTYGSWATGSPGMPSSGATGSYFGGSGGIDPGGYFGP